MGIPDNAAAGNPRPHESRGSRTKNPPTRNTQTTRGIPQPPRQKNRSRRARQDAETHRRQNHPHPLTDNQPKHHPRPKQTTNRATPTQRNPQKPTPNRKTTLLGHPQQTTPKQPPTNTIKQKPPN